MKERPFNVKTPDRYRGNIKKNERTTTAPFVQRDVFIIKTAIHVSLSMQHLA